MNERIKRLKQCVRSGEHRSLRQKYPISVLPECERENLSWPRRAARLIRRQCEAEKIVIGPDEKIVFTRTLPAAHPAIYKPDDWSRITGGRVNYEPRPISNICADWGMVLSQGLLGRKSAAEASRERFAGNRDAVEFIDCAVETIDAVLALAARYSAAARQMGRNDLADISERVPAYPPRSFHEALQSLRLLHSVVWLGGHAHVGLGRFDQYMWPYLKADLDSGRIDTAVAEELLAEFFIALNRDSDLYPGVQQGDNGQTIMLGGTTRDGRGAVNDLTRMVLRVSLDLSMIDPKINLRITPRTDLDLLCLAAELTRKGLGFPQYSNDEVVISGLIAHGYKLEDARDYTVAACWEFIIPGRGMEVVNIGAVSLPFAVDCGIHAGLSGGAGFDGILKATAEDIIRQVNVLGNAWDKLPLPPAPFYSALMTDCIERGRDLSRGALYNNFGIHGAGAANAADALAAVQQFVFNEERVRPDELLTALNVNYEGYEKLQSLLAGQAPKVGNNDDRADRYLTALFDFFADACESYGRTGRGGILRPGSGSAMYYVWLARGRGNMREPVVRATADGRKDGDMLSANLSPAPGVGVRGPISVLQSFAKINYQRICNGGPITMELSDTVFRDAESIRKVAMLVRTFAQLGCQQLQLNSLNVETLRDAKLHPERHKNLIVRVWGWSGYFCELSPEYQDHIIARHVYD